MNIQPMSFWQLMLNNPEWALVAVGMLTMFVIGWQAVETRRAAEASKQAIGIMKRQTNATEDAAKAALSNAQAVINSERAWLIPVANSVESNLLPHFSLAGSFVETFRVQIENCGRTPAWLMDWFFEASVLDDTNISQFTNGGQPEGDFPNARPFPQGRKEDFWFSWTTNSAEIGSIKAADKHLYIHGFLQYRSLAGNDPCLSRFCFHYYHKRDARGGFEEAVKFL